MALNPTLTFTEEPEIRYSFDEENSLELADELACLLSSDDFAAQQTDGS